MFLLPKKSKDLTAVSDEELIIQYHATQNQSLASEIFNRYTHLVFGVCLKYLGDEEDAKDAVMQVMEQVLSQAPKQEIKVFKAWLFTVTKNHCLMQLRREKSGSRMKVELLRELEQEFMEIPQAMHLYDVNEQEKKEERLHDALQKLGTEQKTCIALFYFEDKSYKEISEMTGYDMNAVKSHIQNGKRKLSILMDHGKET
jgi:RNA polymerase sigma factor (sigma-70 family)